MNTYDRRRLLGLLTGAGATLTLGACGIDVPDDVVRDGTGPTAGPGAGPYVSATPVGRTPTEEPKTLVGQFLEAAAGDHGTEASHIQILETLKSYLSPSAAAAWNPGADVNLVRLDSRGLTLNGTKKVDVPVLHLGVLTPDGRVEPPRLGLGRKTYTIEIAPAGTPPGGLVIVKAPDDILLVDKALPKYYDVRPIYFPNSNRPPLSLVPDLRYLPRAVPPEQQGNRLLEWLLGAPSPWLSSVVAKLPEGTARRGSITLSSDKLTVNITATVTEQADLDDLAAQLWWTLRPDHSNRGLQLRTESVPVNTSALYLSKNAAVLDETKAEGPDRYAVVDGSLTRLSSGARTTPPTLALGNVNQDVIAAAVSRGGASVALIRRRGSRCQLWAGTVDKVRDSGLRGAVMAAPTWLDRSNQVLLVIVDGKIHAYSDHSGSWAPVNSDRLPAGPVTAMTVAPDGRRIAVVVNGRLYTAVLVRQVARDTSISIGQPRAVPTSLADLSGVAFTKEDHLVIAGVNELGETVLNEITVDGVLQSDQTLAPSRVHTEITNLVAYVDSPLGNGGGLKILFDLDGVAYQAFGRRAEPLSQFLPGPSAPVSPSPSASPGVPSVPSVSAGCFEG